MFGLWVATIGADNPAAYARFTFGAIDMSGGVDLIPAMIGFFAIAELLRVVSQANVRLPPVYVPGGRIFAGQWQLVKRYPVQWLRGSAVGTIIGALPGAGCDIAAWVTYAMSKQFSRASSRAAPPTMPR